MSTTAVPQSVPYPQGQDEPAAQLQPGQSRAGKSDPDWARLAVGGALLTGAILLLSGKRRAGVVVSAAATALTLLDEQDTVRRWWNALPHYLDDVQQVLDKAQTALEDLAEKRNRLRAMFNR